MITFKNISLQYGSKIIYRETGCLIRDRDRIALVGANGSGKTTFFRLLLEKEQPDRGEITKARNIRIGYLPQELLVHAGRTVFEEAESIFEEIITLKKSLDEDTQRLHELDHSTQEYKALLHDMGEKEHRLEELEAHKVKSRVEAVLLGLGFTMADMNRDCGEFSGGWQMRIALARLLLLEPELLLLDEPTNHLDIMSQRWLEAQLRNYRGALVIISHDQAFLDELCTRTFSVEHNEIVPYEGNYTWYLSEAVRRKEQLEKQAASQQKKIEKTEAFIERFRYKATKARQVQSRIKALEKEERIYTEAGDSRVSFTFPPCKRSGQIVLSLEGMSKSYGDLHLFKDLNLKIERGQKIAIVGPNGCGKSTLAKILAAEESMDKGQRSVGHQVQIGWFAQQQAEELDGEQSVLSCLEAVASAGNTTSHRSLLGSFLFHGDDVYKQVKVLSGGEKSRLALARILATSTNCLLLDEPTNHIDRLTKDVLQEALLNYQGTCLIVSHDRAFLDPLVNSVIEVHRGGLRQMHGNVSDYLEKLEAEEAAKAEQAARSQTTKAVNPSGGKERRRQRAALQEKLRPLKKQRTLLEEKIEAMETRKAELETQMEDPQFHAEASKTGELYREHSKLLEDIDTALEKWESIEKTIQKTAEESPE